MNIILFQKDRSSDATTDPLESFSACYCVPTETTWCVQRAPYIHPLHIQKVERLGKYKSILNLKVANSLHWKTVKQSTDHRKEHHSYPV